MLLRIDNKKRNYLLNVNYKKNPIWIKGRKKRILSIVIIILIHTVCFMSGYYGGNKPLSIEGGILVSLDSSVFTIPYLLFLYRYQKMICQYDIYYKDNEVTELTEEYISMTYKPKKFASKTVANHYNYTVKETVYFKDVKKIKYNRSDKKLTFTVYKYNKTIIYDNGKKSSKNIRAKERDVIFCYLYYTIDEDEILKLIEEYFGLKIEVVDNHEETYYNRIYFFSGEMYHC